MARLPESCAPDELLILCPFLAGLAPEVAMWLGPLAWHDCNATLLAALAGSPASGLPATVFAGVFCADPFRSAQELLGPLRTAGVAGVINLPSVSFLDGGFAETLQALNLGVARELSFLRHARQHGFRMAGCAGDVAMAQALCAAGAELIVHHAGPLAPRATVPRRAAKRPDAAGPVPEVMLADLFGTALC